MEIQIIKHWIMKNLKFLICILLTICTLYSYSQNVKADNPLNGPKTEYYPSGKICKQYVLSDGKISGLYKFFSEKGFLVSEQNMTDGVPNGLMKTFFENGQVKSESMYKDGMATGYSKEYYESGQLKSDSQLTGNPWEYTGTTMLYYDTGALNVKSVVENGKLVSAIHYDKEGRVTMEESEGKNITYWYETATGKKHTVVNGVEQK